jgi:hypothetical protein
MATVCGAPAVQCAKKRESMIAQKRASMSSMPQRRASAREMEIRQKMAEQLRRHRGTHSRSAHARATGIDRWTLDRLERLDAPITVELVEQLAGAMSLPTIELLCGGSDPIWPGVDLESRLQAIQQRALDEAEAEVGRFRGQLGERYLASMMAAAGNLAQHLQDFEARLNLIRHEVTVDNLNRELADQRRELRTARRLVRGEPPGSSRGRR